MIRLRKKRKSEEINPSSMADIAFLLLIFFLVATTMVVDTGLEYILPPKAQDNEETLKQKKNNVMHIILNSYNKILIENQGEMPMSKLKDQVKLFITNNGKNPDWSESPKKAVVIFRADRGTDYATYVSVVNELKGSYNELRAEYLKISVDDYLRLDKRDPEDNYNMQKAQKKIPWNLSEEDPSDIK